MKRYIRNRWFSALGFMFLFTFGACSGASVNQQNHETAFLSPNTGGIPVSKWEYAKKEHFESYTLTREVKDARGILSEEFICDATVPVKDIPGKEKIVFVYGVHLLRLYDGSWASSTESITLEDGRITNRYTLRRGGYKTSGASVFIKGAHSPFFTYCDPLKDGLPKEVSALIKKPASDFVPLLPPPP